MPISSSNSPVLVFEPHWSVQRWMLVGAQCVICIVIPWLIPYWTVTARLMLSLFACVLLAIGYWRAGWWGSKRITRVTWQQSGAWLLTRANENAVDHVIWSLMDDSYVVPWLMVLRWYSTAGTARLIILPGEMLTTAWRQWQTRLNLQGGRVPHPSSPEL